MVDMINSQEFLPTSAKEVAALGWQYIDVILFTGDAYVDHPSFGAAVIGRLLEGAGYRVAIVAQPNWRDDLRDFKKLGRPRLFFGVSAGAMDSMVNHYTATKRLRSDDAYTPGSKAGQRPDYPTVVYSQILKQLYPDVPVVIGGIEASLRRLTHYDYWQDKLRPSFLVESGADLLSYGMGDKVILEIAETIKNGGNLHELKQVVYLSDTAPTEDQNTDPNDQTIMLHSFEQCAGSKELFAENFATIEIQSNRMHAKRLVEPVGDKYVVVNPPYPYLSEKDMDHSFDLPYTRLPHPRYWGKGQISAYEMIKHSVNLHRGCFGGCSFCTISAHQGKFISSRSEHSIMREIKKVTSMEDFKGNLSDIGGPSANMYRMQGRDTTKCERCSRASCIFPSVCPNLDNNHRPLLSLYEKIRDTKGVKHAYVGSGIRYDMIDDSPYLEQIIVHHTSGRLKVAPEHTQDNVLKLMRKPSYTQFTALHKDFDKICAKHGMPYQLIPYFISSHPGCTEADMKSLADITKAQGFRLEQVQDFTPTPMTLSSVMFYTGIDPYTKTKLYVARSKEDKDKQKSHFFWYKKPEGYRKAEGSQRPNYAKKPSSTRTYDGEENRQKRPSNQPPKWKTKPNKQSK